ncbi:hypothetical protein MPTK1_4g16390 [Marchantia polymorpha subsp. ruderalis]|uniref:Uncharacterized protein n=2 Tax=Marchantia polymorpha TaxID=3197 RepID=A0AAF6BAI0_MARPO|nr:hypothetical protein MARPO_0054s0104 [Marchantia polymorpha]BBN09014.1 hypothetical protein Mp_4g16390 [Marchantia polymorpha subsp. ruderalis]|eukprot:PTQ38003.1 hypothetical protein MARPO_0054s0104 [Marchantia polymorpha]
MTSPIRKEKRDLARARTVRPGATDNIVGNEMIRAFALCTICKQTWTAQVKLASEISPHGPQYNNRRRDKTMSLAQRRKMDYLKEDGSSRRVIQSARGKVAKSISHISIKNEEDPKLRWCTRRTILNQKQINAQGTSDSEKLYCVYVAIGQKRSN